MATDPSAVDVMSRLGLPPLAVDLAARSGRCPVSVVIAVEAQLNPNAIALVGPEERLTWTEVDRRIVAAEHALIELGVMLRDVVAVELPNSIEHVIATQAVWRVGGTVLPLDPKMPDRIRRLVLERVSPKVLVAEGQASDLPRSRLASLPESSHRSRHLLPDPHAILMTSGTSGSPKLVLQRGAAWGHLPEEGSELDSHGMRSRQRTLMALPMYHGFGFGYTNLLGLGRSHSIAIVERFEADEVLTAIEDLEINYLPVVPTMLSRMVQSSRFESTNLSSVEAVLHAAAPCPTHVKTAWMDRIGPRKVYEAYGATDVAVHCVIRGDEWEQHPGSVGRPVHGQVQIVDSDLNQLAANDIGEIATVGGTNHPEILDDSLSAPSLDLRCTGDLGYLDSDGYLYVVDRAGRQILVGGINIWPGRVEECLLSHPAVVDARVYGLPHHDLGEVVGAEVQLYPELPSTVDVKDELTRWCSNRLERQAVPREFRFVQEVERSALGKLSKRRGDVDHDG